MCDREYMYGNYGDVRKWFHCKYGDEIRLNQINWEYFGVDVIR